MPKNIISNNSKSMERTIKRSTSSSNAAKVDVRQLIRSAKTESQVNASKTRSVETNFELGELICATVTSATK